MKSFLDLRLLGTVGLLGMVLGWATAVAGQTVFSGAEFRVNEYVTGGQGLADVVIDDDGNFLVAWSGDYPSGDAVYARWYTPNGVPASGEFKVNQTSTSAGDTSVGLLGDGSAVVVWAEAEPQIKGRLVSHLGGPIGDELLIPSLPEWYMRDPAVATGRQSSHFVVAWHGVDESVFARRVAVDGTPAGDQFRVNTCTACSNVDNIRVNMGTNGHFVVTWADGNDLMARIYAPSGQPVGTDFEVDPSHSVTHNGGAAVDAIGKSFVVWGAGYVVGVEYDPLGSPLSAPVLLNDEAQTSVYPHVSQDAFGSFVVTYNDWNGPWSVFTHAFATADQPLEANLQVNSAEEHAGGQARVAINDTGEGVVAWDTYPLDLDARDVYARSFTVRFALFRDGFESGGQGAWSAMQP